MNSDIRVRALAVVGLGVLGVVLALSGATFGVGNSLASDDPAPEFRISADNISVVTGDDRVTLVENASAVAAIEISRTEGGVTVRTDERAPLTERDRRRAADIALANDTVERYLDGIAEYDIDVRPIQRLTADESVTIGNVTTVNSASDGSTDFIVVSTESSNLTVADWENSVTVNRQSSYVDGVASVVVSVPGDELVARVNLTRGAVEDISR